MRRGRSIPVPSPNQLSFLDSTGVVQAAPVAPPVRPNLMIDLGVFGEVPIKIGRNAIIVNTLAITQNGTPHIIIEIAIDNVMIKDQRTRDGLGVVSLGDYHLVVIMAYNRRANAIILKTLNTDGKRLTHRYNNSYPHPHIATNFCLGDRSAAMQTALARNNLAGYLFYAVDFFKYYNSGSPFKRLEDFEPGMDFSSLSRSNTAINGIIGNTYEYINDVFPIIPTKDNYGITANGHFSILDSIIHPENYAEGTLVTTRLQRYLMDDERISYVLRQNSRSAYEAFNALYKEHYEAITGRDTPANYEQDVRRYMNIPWRSNSRFDQYFNGDSLILFRGLPWRDIHAEFRSEGSLPDETKVQIADTIDENFPLMVHDYLSRGAIVLPKIMIAIQERLLEGERIRRQREEAEAHRREQQEQLNQMNENAIHPYAGDVTSNHFITESDIILNPIMFEIYQQRSGRIVPRRIGQRVRYNIQNLIDYISTRHGRVILRDQILFNATPERNENEISEEENEGTAIAREIFSVFTSNFEQQENGNPVQTATPLQANHRRNSPSEDRPVNESVPEPGVERRNVPGWINDFHNGGGIQAQRRWNRNPFAPPNNTG